MGPGSPGRARRRWVVYCLAALSLSGCLRAHPPNGAFQCSAQRECPSDYFCGPDATCWGNATPRQRGAATFDASTSGTPDALSLPAGVAPGDLLIVLATSLAGSDTVLDCPDAGWKKISSTSATAPLFIACVKTATAQDRSPFALHLNVPMEYATMTLAFSGAALADANGAGGPVSPPLTTTAASPLFVLADAVSFGGTLAPPPGATALGHADNGRNVSLDAAMTVMTAGAQGYPWTVAADARTGLSSMTLALGAAH